MAILLNILLVIYVLVALLMIFVILMQRPKSEGLGAAFGGGVTENIFGAQTTNVLVKFTGWLAGIFFFLTFALSVLYAHRSGASSGLRQELMKTAPAPTSEVPLTPQAGPAVGPPGTVTNPAPGDSNVNQGNPPTPADQAVGVTGPAAEASAAPSASPNP
ncbi:MAG: preprotein translocase subunit SecG [Verrucomicrobiota bacterium]|nr:preprotein translocase subunit SecG [Verrucomicrobiota bacterium]